jgi:hypothetical protein
MQNKRIACLLFFFFCVYWPRHTEVKCEAKRISKAAAFSCRSVAVQKIIYFSYFCNHLPPSWCMPLSNFPLSIKYGKSEKKKLYFNPRTHQPGSAKTLRSFFLGRWMMQSTTTLSILTCPHKLK